VCLHCGRIEEFHDDRIEKLQREAALKRGFRIASHDHRLLGHCRACVRAGHGKSAEAATNTPSA
jgi:Fur family ferric uptake transcriptional regulator